MQAQERKPTSAVLFDSSIEDEIGQVLALTLLLSYDAKRETRMSAECQPKQFEDRGFLRSHEPLLSCLFSDWNGGKRTFDNQLAADDSICVDEAD
jgi:hypothetical protein